MITMYVSLSPTHTHAGTRGGQRQSCTHKNSAQIQCVAPKSGQGKQDSLLNHHFLSLTSFFLQEIMQFSLSPEQQIAKEQ